MSRPSLLSSLKEANSTNVLSYPMSNSACLEVTDSPRQVVTATASSLTKCIWRVHILVSAWDTVWRKVVLMGRRCCPWPLDRQHKLLTLEDFDIFDIKVTSWIVLSTRLIIEGIYRCVEMPWRTYIINWVSIGSKLTTAVWERSLFPCQK